ncbi:LPXTG cell wall anchor domain-containing protein [Paenibacillus sp. NFR01]|uniref:LPXTG cell wall anchor domain-containing protein n=1 Tax=Paenibacillus sp. NFR01 TaxID=1566279 RepID=UPI0008CC8506|nr:LPXTG cell wall anchor domain-containing protein [Paenibacillus sp. NFR01]SET54595.1 LPXTG-motif cell wall anchor domain-containing protein [Paenibacillus sp. NFR01]
MLKKRISVALALLLLFVQVAYGNDFSPQAKAAAIENNGNILTSITMSVYGSNGQTVTDNVYTLDDQVILDYTWALPDGHNYKEGDSFTFSLPAQFALFNDISGSLSSADGDVGTFTVNRATHQVVMTFNDYIKTHGNVQGTLRIETNFDKQTITGSTVQEVVFPLNGGSQTVTLKFRPQSDKAIGKAGSSPGFNPDHLDWTIDINKKLETISQPVVTDPLPAGLSPGATVTAAVYELDVRLDGTLVQGALLDASRYAVSAEGGVIKVTFADGTISSAYRIALSTPITDLSQTSFTNTATLSGDGRDPESASATVDIQRGGSLKKVAANYEWGKQTITWALEYNYGAQNIPADNAVLQDWFDDTVEFVPGSLKVYPVTLDAAGNATKGTPLTENADYTVTPTWMEKKMGFELKFNKAVTSPYRVEYKTSAAYRVYKDTTVRNTVTDSTYTSEATQLLRTAIIYKTLSAVDYRNHTTDWKITVNGDRYMMASVVVTDSFPQGGQKLDPSTIVIRDASGDVVEASSYKLEYASPIQPNVGFKVKFRNVISNQYTISYRTEFNFDWITGNTDNFNNTARVEWTDESKIVKSVEAKGLFIPRAEAKQNGFKKGAYDAAAKELTWTVGVNYNSKALNDAVVSDPLGSGQTLVPGSLHVYPMLLDANGDYTLGTEVSTGNYTVDASAGNALKVHFTSPIKDPYVVVFKTSLAGQLIGKDVSNKAVLLDGGKQVSKDLVATVTIPHGDEYVFKDGVQAGDRVNWTVLINRTQSHVAEAAITDEPSGNQLLVPDSFRLYKAVVAANGEVTAGGSALVKDTDYTLEIGSDSSGKQTFTLRFLQPIDTAYVLEYESLIVAASGEKLTNTVKLTGSNVVLVNKETTKELIVGVSSGSGTGSGERGSLTVHKVDAANPQASLSGAVFTLYRLSGSDRVLVGTRATDTSGNAEFAQLWLGSYVLTETTAPAGYALNAQEYPVTIGSAAKVNLTVTNTALPVSTPTPTPGPSTAPTTGPTTAPTASPSEVPGVIIDEPEIPAGGPGGSATPSPSAGSTPQPGDVTITDDDVPQGGVKPEDDDVTGGAGNPAKLPQTGESSPAPIYWTGFGLIVLGLALSRIRRGRREE